MNRQAGMGLVEVIVGIGMMALAIMGMNALAVTMIRGNLSAQLNDQATRLAQSKLEQVRQGGYAKATVGTATESVPAIKGKKTGVVFQRETKVADGALANVRTVTVTMRWWEHAARRIVLRTEIAQ